MTSDRIKAIMAEVLEIETRDIGDDFGPDSSDNWDSLRNLQLVTALEVEFDVNLTMAEIESMVDLATIAKVIESHLSANKGG